MATDNGSARIGKSVVIRGEVKGAEDLIVDGRVEGTVTLTESRLTIGPNANVAADLSARDVLIQGNVQGNIVASGRVELRAARALGAGAAAACGHTRGEHGGDTHRRHDPRSPHVSSHLGAG